MKAKRLTAALELCTDEPKSVADKLRYARLSAGLHQDTLATKIGIDKCTILRYENGKISEERMEAAWLAEIALACGKDKYFCCSPYHVFLLEEPGAQIKAYRTAQGLTQKEFATRLGVWENTVKRWEWQKNKPPVYVWELISGVKSIEL